MYPLGDQFKINTNPITDEGNIIKGSHYRISILKSNVLRLEYSEAGVFLDKPTSLILNRNFGKSIFEKKEDNNFLEITTPYFKLTYAKEKSFIGNKFSPNSNLKIQIGEEIEWYYDNPEVRNLGTSGNILLDSIDSKNKEKGLYSLDGYTVLDDSNNKVLEEDGTFSERDNKEIDIYIIIYKKDFNVCLKDYFNLTGSPSLIPRYALGNWWSKKVPYDNNKVEELVEQFKRKKIPLSIFLFDKYWHKSLEKIETGYTFDNNLISEPNKMINLLDKNHIHVGLSLNPDTGFFEIDDNYQEATKYLSPDENGIIPFAVLNPRWVDVYLKMYIHPLDNMNIDFYWLKINNIPKEQIFLLNHYQTYDRMRNSDKRPFILSKFSGIADHRYPILYSGRQDVSWKTLADIPIHNIMATNKGISWWAHDIGGYSNGIEESELYIRFIQLGVFSPILKFGTDSCKYYKREPWLWDIKTYSIVREYLNLRHSLIPYYYCLAYNYYKDSYPLLRPIYYENEGMIDDSRYNREYYIGKELLVCPIISKKEPVMNRSIHRMYIPSGTWYDFVTGKKFPGNKEYISFFKEEDYPVFARAGSIIPMGINDDINDTNPPKYMEIHVFPGCSNSFKLYEDDGKTNLYLKGYYLLTSIDYKYEQSGYTLTLKALEGRMGIAPDYRDYKIRFRNTKKTDKVGVALDGTPTEFTTYVDGNDFLVEVKNVKTTGQLQVHIIGENLEIEATRIINNDIDDILNDLQIETEMKQTLANILFSELPIKKKRIEVRKIKGLEKKFKQLFLKLLEYIEQV